MLPMHGGTGRRGTLPWRTSSVLRSGEDPCLFPWRWLVLLGGWAKSYLPLQSDNMAEAHSPWGICDQGRSCKAALRAALNLGSSEGVHSMSATTGKGLEQFLGGQCWVWGPLNRGELPPFDVIELELRDKRVHWLCALGLKFCSLKLQGVHLSL